MYRLLDYDYELPEELIADRPTSERTGSRLLVMRANDYHFRHEGFGHIERYLRSGDLLVFNNTKVIPARLFCSKLPSGGSGEILVEKFLPGGLVLCQTKFNRPPKVGQVLLIHSDKGDFKARVGHRSGRFLAIQFELEQPPMEVIQRHGTVPLPPYIKRPADQGDSRYQTIYASRSGAVAAPTAGLHFDRTLLDLLADKGVDSCELTLHIGSATFQPVRVEDIRRHSMHREWCEISAEVVAKIKACRKRGNRVIAVGTTSIRALETAATNGGLKPWSGETDIFIYPPYEFQLVDAIITNFHMPVSTLLMLVCAFAGYDATMKAYGEALKQRYRFLSYGDAMLILPRDHVF